MIHVSHQMDMRDIKLTTKFDGVIITARSISYILTNKDVMATFYSIRNVLNDRGVLIFDFIDARTFIPTISEGEIISHEVDIDDIKYKRESVFQKNVGTNWNWIWKSTFMKLGKNGYEEIGSDEAELRAFTSDEMEIFLTLSGFKTLQVLDRRVYAFDTKVIVTQK